MYTQYSVVVQARNRVGTGPMSEEVLQYTGEGTPEQAPQNVTCTALTSHSIRLSWTSPMLHTVNGIIKGYKAIYGPSHVWFGRFPNSNIDRSWITFVCSTRRDQQGRQNNNHHRNHSARIA